MTPETCTTSNTQRTDSDETANVAPLACPFCGGQSICPSAWDIQCSDCSASIPGDPLVAIEAWNRRAAPTLPADVKLLVRELTDRAEWRALNEGPFTKKNLVEFRAAAALTAQAALLDELLSAAKTVMAGLDARIDEASANGGTAVPVFAGIAALHDAIGAASRLHHEMAEG